MESHASRFQSELLPNESILWTGQPDPTIYFNQYDSFMVPFSLLWCGGVIFWEAGVLGEFKAHANVVPIILPIWGIPFVLVGCYMVFGRFIFKAWQKRRTYYAVTNQRILILSRSIKCKTFKALFINGLAEINKSSNDDHIGSIIFGSGPTRRFQSVNSGMDVFSASPIVGFFDIPQVDSVYNLILSQRQI